MKRKTQQKSDELFSANISFKNMAWGLNETIKSHTYSYKQTDKQTNRQTDTPDTAVPYQAPRSGNGYTIQRVLTIYN